MESEYSEDCVFPLVFDALERRIRFEFGREFGFWGHEKIHIDRHRRQNSNGMTGKPQNYWNSPGWEGVSLGNACSGRFVRTELRFLAAA